MPFKSATTHNAGEGCSSITNYRLGELFCGAGGMAWGAFHADIGNGDRIMHTWANDYDETACATYRRNLCADAPETVFCADVRNFIKNIDNLPNIDAFAYGFPCNSFSQAGERQGLGNDKFGALYMYGIEVMKKKKPLWFIAENVSGLTSANDGNAFNVILKDMKEAGYKVYPHLYEFEKYGVPQTRHRVIIAGIRNDLPFEFKIPIPTNKTKNCREAIEIPAIPENAANNELTKQSAQVIERLKYIKPGENAFTADLPPHLRLKVKGAKISQIYKRLDPDKPAYTVTGSGGGGTHIYHWSEPRALTNRERARLQTFPDEFVFEGSKEDVRRQIGMAVPCDGSKIIFEAVIKTFAGIEYDSIEPNLGSKLQR